MPKKTTKKAAPRRTKPKEAPAAMSYGRADDIFAKSSEERKPAKRNTEFMTGRKIEMLVLCDKLSTERYSMSLPQISSETFDIQDQRCRFVCKSRSVRFPDMVIMASNVQAVFLAK